MYTKLKSAKLPIPVQRALTKLGKDIRGARVRRRISTLVMAERCLIARTTLHKVENGDSGVSIGTYATALFVLGLTDRLMNLADVRFDEVGLALEEERLPQRIHSKPWGGSSRKKRKQGV